MDGGKAPEWDYFAVNAVEVEFSLDIVLVNTRPHQLCWGDQERGTAIVYKKLV